MAGIETPPFSAVGAETIYDSRYLQITNNLSDVNNVVTARSSLGLGSLATLNTNTTALTSYLLLSGGTLTGNLLFTDNTLDIGASGATRPRTGYFGTSLVSPLVIGGSGTTQTLILRSTSGIGATGADIIFQVGNNGATEAMRILNSGNVGIGTTTPATKLDISDNSANAALQVSQAGAGLSASFPNATTAAKGLQIGTAVGIYDAGSGKLQFGGTFGATQIGAATDVNGAFVNLSGFSDFRISSYNDGEARDITLIPHGSGKVNIDATAGTVTAVFQRAIINNTSAITTNTGATAVYGLTINEPNITTGTVQATNSASLYIPGAATEAVNNYALWVDAGNVRFDGDMILGASSKNYPLSGVAGFSVVSTALTLGSAGSIIAPYADMGNAANDAARDALAGNVDGAIAIDNTGVAAVFKIWARVGGAWKSATIA